MKKGILAALMLLIAATGAAQTLDEIYTTFRDKPGVEFTTLSGKFIMEQMKAQRMQEMQEQWADTTSLDSAQQAEMQQEMEEKFKREIEESFNKDSDDEKLAKLKMLDSIVVLNFEDCDKSLIEQFEKMTANLKALGYDVLVDTSEDGDRTSILYRMDDECMTELLVRHIEADEAQLVRLTGHFNKDDWNKIIMN